MSIETDVGPARDLLARIDCELGRTIIGQDNLRTKLLVSLLSNGHVLLEGVPGLAKTLSIKTLAGLFGGEFKRIQFTPDLLPSDVVGTEIFRQQDGRFEIRRGPVFANFVLADEINRAPAKVQSALLETMQERQVTIGGETLLVPSPFFVLATQNPIEQEGTYPLPEAQLDRFLMKVRVGYPSKEEELKLLEGLAELSKAVPPISSLSELQSLQLLVQQIYVDPKVKDYIVSLVAATRAGTKLRRDAQRFIALGASPRASLALHIAARALALLQGSYFVTPQHVRSLAFEVLRHRIVLSFEAEASGKTADDVITELLESVEVP